VLLFHRQRDGPWWKRIISFLAVSLFVLIFVVGCLVFPLWVLSLLSSVAPSLGTVAPFPFSFLGPTSLSVSTVLLCLPHLFSAVGMSDPRTLHDKRGLLVGQRAVMKLLEWVRDWMAAGSAMVLDTDGVLKAGEGGQAPTMVCLHPHGIFTLGLTMLGPLFEVKDFTLVFAHFLYWLQPVLRLLLDPILKTASASRASVNALMRSKRNFAIIPGGFHEAVITKRATDRVFLSKRKGFVKFALRHGYSLTPVYVFGETDSYTNLQGGWGVRFLLSALQLPAVAFWGLWFSPLTPRRARLVAVVGDPIQLPRVENPSKQQVDDWHRQYVDALQRLYNKYKHAYYRAEQHRQHGLHPAKCPPSPRFDCKACVAVDRRKLEVW